MKLLQRICLGISAMALLTLFAGLLMANTTVWQPAAVSLAVSFAIGMGGIAMLKNYQYTAWIIVAVVSAMIYPHAFLKWGAVDLRNKWLILVIVQMVMFGMGIQMSIKDFSGLGSTGKGCVDWFGLSLFHYAANGFPAYSRLSISIRRLPQASFLSVPAPAVWHLM
jgi:BASS family bile acid:Na+ symporter